MVALSEKAQIDELSVSRTLLDEHTIYSVEAAEELARGLCQKTGSRLCAAVTGNAGPDYCDGIEPGTFFISVLYDGKMTSRRYHRVMRSLSLNIELMAR